MASIDHDVAAELYGIQRLEYLDDAHVLCQCHGSRWDITTGAVINGPAKESLNVYGVQEADDGIQIRA